MKGAVMSESKLLYKRVLLKISGEALKGRQEHGFSQDAVADVVARIKNLSTNNIITEDKLP